MIQCMICGCMFSRISRGKHKKMLEIELRSTSLTGELCIGGCLSTRIKITMSSGSYPPIQVVAFDLLRRLFRGKSSCPLVDVWFNVTLHQKTLEILEMVSENAMV